MRSTTGFVFVLTVWMSLTGLSWQHRASDSIPDHVPQASVLTWKGLAVGGPISASEHPDVLYGDQHGMHDTIWASELVSAYKSKRISGVDLLRELWVHRPEFAVALGEFCGSYDITPHFLRSVIAGQSNGLVAVAGGVVIKRSNPASARRPAHVRWMQAV